MQYSADSIERGDYLVALDSPGFISVTLVLLEQR